MYSFVVIKSENSNHYRYKLNGSIIFELSVKGDLKSNKVTDIFVTSKEYNTEYIREDERLFYLENLPSLIKEIKNTKNRLEKMKYVDILLEDFNKSL